MTKFYSYKMSKTLTVNVEVLNLLIGSFSNYDGDSNENVIQKTNFTLLNSKLLRYYPN